MTLASSRAPVGVRLLPLCLPPGAAAVLTLDFRRCRWPLGDVEDETFRFCLEPSGHRGYCPAHARLARRGAR